MREILIKGKGKTLFWLFIQIFFTEQLNESYSADFLPFSE